MKRCQLTIIGAGGHSRVLADIARLEGYVSIRFLSDGGEPGISGKVHDYVKYIDGSDFFVAIGNNAVRKRICEQLIAKGASLINLIHPNAVIAENTIMGTGVAAMAGAVVNPGSRIGNGVILNTCCSVDHDCVIGDFAHISVGARLAGTVCVGDGVFVCAGAVVINDICICDNVVIGAGAVVVKNIAEPGTYVGVPAKRQSFWE